MKTKIIFTVAFLLCVLSVSAQKHSYKGELTVSPKALEQRGDSLYVNLDFVMKGVNVNSRKSVEFIPTLISPTKKLKLPEISVKGRNNYNVYRRRMALMTKKEKAAYKNPYYQVCKGYKNDASRTVNYRYTLPYESWMSSARLDLQEDACGCAAGNASMVSMQRLVNNVSLETIIVIEPYQINPYMAYVQPQTEMIKRRAQQNESYLDYAVGQSTIRSDFGNNPIELSKIRAMIEDVKGDDAVTIRQINIVGYASPDGSSASNKRLSEARAKAFKDYIQSRYDISENLYSVSFGGEDWIGLRKAVEESGIQSKNEVLSVLDNVVDETKRKAKIASLGGGVPYKTMLKDIYPSLRRVAIKVEYNVKSFDLLEAKEVIQTKPQNLSLNEMYLVANTYTKGSQDFNDVFETAVKMFPTDETANMNAAASALSRGDVVSAEKYLGKVKSRVRIPEVDNSRGVLMMFKGDYEKAEQYLRSAEQAGLAEATKNLEELSKKLSNIDEIKKNSK